jgi:hypothetical protein
MSGFAELAVTTNFSFLRGASHGAELVQRAAELGLSAIGVADRNTLAGVVRAHTAAKEAGLKLLVGARLVPLEGPEILAYPMDRAAYGRLSRLLSDGKMKPDVPKGECHLTLESILAASEGQVLIVMPPAVPPAGFADTLRGSRPPRRAAPGSRRATPIPAATGSASPGWRTSPPLQASRWWRPMTYSTAPYFLTVHDIVAAFSPLAEHPVPGARLGGQLGTVCYLPRHHRGRSGAATRPAANSAVFERFISPERREPPDIDVDFEHERREEVIQYVYGNTAGTAPGWRRPSSPTGRARPFAKSARRSACRRTSPARSPARLGLVGDAGAGQAHREAGLDPRSADPPRHPPARQLIGFPRHLSQHVGGFV